MGHRLCAIRNDPALVWGWISAQQAGAAGCLAVVLWCYSLDVWSRRFFGVPLTKTKPTKTQKRKAEYIEGPEARENFDRTMKILFRSPKIGLKKKGKD